MSYLEENNKVFALEKITEPGGHRGEARAYSIKLILYDRFISLLRGLVSYPKEIIKNWPYFIDLFKLKNTQNSSKCIIVGGGPSLEILNIQSLKKFKRNGGKIIAVNYWADNIFAGEIIPDFISISDPLVLADEAYVLQKFSSSEARKYINKNNKLLNYLIKNPSIKILTPLNFCNQFSLILPKHKLIGYVDTQIPGISSAISPLLPRGYKGLSFYKALALCCYFGFERIYLIGLDNSYIRNIYSNRLNKVHVREEHSGEDDFIVDFSKVRDGVAGFIDDQLLNFLHLKLFKNSKFGSRIVNLDQFSLTDLFKKVENPNQFINNE